MARIVQAAPAAPPATDFFAAQDVARARARRWFVLFGLCVVAVVIAIDAYVVLIVAVQDHHYHAMNAPGAVSLAQAVARVPREVVLLPIAMTLALVLAGSIRRRRQLQRGADTLAQSIGARRVVPESTDEAERRLRNVAEEMALAAGTLPPALYVLDREAAINAFAGASAREPFVVVTRGALQALQRDELQALVAYGLAQLRHGDAALNLRLIGWLAGITVIADTGMHMIKMPYYSIRDAEGKIGDVRKVMMFMSIHIAFFGLLVALIGYVGLLLARIMRARLSHHRVHLADATAVQYTRDAVAVRDLLGRVEADPSRGRLVGAYKEEFGPMLFVPGVTRLCLRTHPRIPRRIARLERAP